MPRTSIFQTSFNSGEWSPRLLGRSDIDRYDSGCAALQNFVPMIQGPARKRPGTRFVDEVKDSTEKCRLVRFEFSDEQAYVLLFGPSYIRIYRNEGRLDSGGMPVEVVTTYTEAELFELSVYAQSADVLYIAHHNHPPAKLTRTSATSWSISDIDFHDGPYDSTNTTSTTINPSGFLNKLPGTTGTLTASSAIFSATRDVGRLVRLRNGTPPRRWGVLRITGVSSTTVVSAEIVREMGDNAAGDTEWRLGAWYDDTTPNWPSVVAFHDQRLIFAADPEHPQTFYGSVSGDFEAFSPTGSVVRNENTWGDVSGADGSEVNDDNAYVFTIAANDVNKVLWLASARTLLIGTQGGVWVAQASRQQEVITPTNISVVRAVTKGASTVAPAGIEQSIFYVAKGRRKVYLVGFSLEKDSFVPEDIGLLAEHITGDGVSDLVFVNEPDPVAWMVRDDGQLIGITFNGQQEVTGWHRHVLGGSFASGDAVVESLAVIPATAGAVSSGAADNPAHDQLWLIVKRTIDGTTKRYVEVMEEVFQDGFGLEDAFFVDCGLSYSGAAATTIAGLDHLVGETVAVLADGSKKPDAVVDSAGEIELEESATRVHVGLPYTSTLRLLPHEGGNKRTSTQGKERRANHIALLLDRTLGGEIATDDDGTVFAPLIYSKAGDPLGNPPPLFTGNLTFDVEQGWGLRNQITVRHMDPYPCTLLGIASDAHFSESGVRG